MQNQAAWIGGGIAWCLLVFVGTFYLTFPSDAVVARLEAEAPAQLGEQYRLDVADASPWWAGLAVSDVKLYQHEGRAPAEGEVPELVAFAKDVRLRASPWSLVTRTPYVSGSITLTEGVVDYAVGTALDERGQVLVSEADITSDQLPLADLLMLMPSVPGTATGNIDIDVQVEAGENGLTDATGRVSITGADLVLSDLEIPGVGPLGMEIPMQSVRLEGDIREGKWEIDRGLFESDLVKVQVKGSVSLRDPVSRSTMDIELVVSDLGEQFAAFEPLLASAKGSDDAYHWQCRGMVSRMRGCSPSRGSVSSRRTSRPRPSSRPSATSTPRTADRGEVDEERERRREEIRERLRKKREERLRDDDGEPEPRYEDDEPEDERFDDEPEEEAFDDEEEFEDLEFED